MGNKEGKPSRKDKTHLLQTCDEHEGSINCMDLSDDGSVLVTGGDDGTIRLWTAKSDMVECLGILEGHEEYITSVSIEDNFVISTSADTTIKKWNISTCECLITFKGHESTVNKVVCTGDFLFSISYDKKARCWDFDTGECVRVFSGHKNNISSILYIPADTEIQTDALHLIQMAKKQLAQKGNKLPPLKNEIDHIQNGEENMYSKDLIITGSLDSSAKSWSIETGECVHTFKGHAGPVTCLATDQKGRILFTGSSDHTIKSWDIMTGQLLKTFTGHQTTVLSLTANRKLLYSTSSDHTARCWIMEFADCTRVYKDHTHSVPALIEHEGLVFTACGDTFARCFDGKSGALKRTFKGHKGAINCLRIIDDRLFTGSFDGTLRIWDASELTAEKTDKHKEKDDKVAPQMQTMRIENEMRKHHNDDEYDQRIDSAGIEESEFNDRRPTRVNVRENPNYH